MALQLHPMIFAKAFSLFSVTILGSWVNVHHGRDKGLLRTKLSQVPPEAVDTAEVHTLSLFS
jgi:hypothetical protein